jgi:protein arginine kinase
MSVKPTVHLRERLDSLPPWLDGTGPDAEIIVSTRIRVARNLVDHRFPPRASPQERTVVYEKVAAAVRKQSPESVFSSVNFSGIDPIDQQLFVERRIASPSLLQTEGDRGVIYDDAHSVNILINEEDHLRLQSLVSGCRPAEAWRVVDRFDELLGRELDYAFTPKRGFLTASPINSGTGLRVSFLLHLPGLVLTKAIDAVLQGASQMGIATRGFFGDHAEVMGSFFQLSNHATMGADENEFIESAQRTIGEVVRHEREARVQLLREARLELTDKVYRALGILHYARTLSIPEYLNLTSALRLGIDCGLLSDLSIEEVNRTTLLVMPAHLQKQAKRAMNETDLAVARAERVRTALLRRRPKKNTRSAGNE